MRRMTENKGMADMDSYTDCLICSPGRRILDVLSKY